jgi:MoxR-like ATPase
MAPASKKTKAVLKEELLRSVWPDYVLPQIPHNSQAPADYSVKPKVVCKEDKSGKDTYFVHVDVIEQAAEVVVATAQEQIPDEFIDNYFAQAITVDQFIEDKSVGCGRAIGQELLDVAMEKIPDINLDQAYDNITNLAESKPYRNTYVLQEFFDENGDRIEMSDSFMDTFLPAGEVEIPSEFTVDVPKDIVVDTPVTDRVVSYILDGMPAVGLAGPTGAGKSHHARHIAGLLQKYGYAAIVVDANGRLTGDRLFEREDFNQDGTFVLEGVLLNFARRTKELGMKGLVIGEEYNAFNDATRREFYRLLSDRDRVYEIMSSKYEGDTRRVDFSHVQFLFTSNPLTDQYITDDLKPLSQAEQRRITTVYLDYPEKAAQLKKIFQTMIESRKDSVARLPKGIKPNLNMATKLFKLIHKADAKGVNLGFDAGYTPVAQATFWAAVGGNTPESWTTALDDFLFTKITDITVREVIVQRINAELGIKVPPKMITKGV